MGRRRVSAGIAVAVFAFVTRPASAPSKTLRRFNAEWTFAGATQGFFDIGVSSIKARQSRKSREREGHDCGNRNLE
jgi:hypothetical protein